MRNKGVDKKSKGSFSTIQATLYCVQYSSRCIRNAQNAAPSPGNRIEILSQEGMRSSPPGS